MSYTSKYTGNEIDELLDMVNNNTANIIELADINFTSTAATKGSKPNKAVELSDSLENYDFLLFESYAMQEQTKKNKQALFYVPTIVANGYGLGVAGYFVDAQWPNNYGWAYDVEFTSSTSFTIRNMYSEFYTYVHAGKVYGIKLRGASSSDFTPVGNIISFMGTKAPNGYLVCDGAELEISKYAKLAAHFEEQFGTKNHFGGDGETTFAVPDLRNEFLRGYHNGKDEQLSGEVGIHQDATLLPNVWSYTNPNNTTRTLTLERIPDTSEHTTTLNADKSILRDVRELVEYKGTAIRQTDSQYLGYPLYNTSRPTNVAVLYCIKY